MKEKLIAFEKRVAEAFERKEIKGPVHLSGGNEDELIQIFRAIHPEDWVLCSYRQHYHALLKGIAEEKVWQKIVDGHSMTMCFPEHNFLSTAIVGGQLSIAVGVAAALKRTQCHRRVWVFCGDMAATTGAFIEATAYARGHSLPVTFVVEHNGMSCNTPTGECWGDGETESLRIYDYQRVYPHVGTGKFIQF